MANISYNSKVDYRMKKIKKALIKQKYNRDSAVTMSVTMEYILREANLWRKKDLKKMTKAVKPKRFHEEY